MKHILPPLVLPASDVIRRRYSSVRDLARESCSRQTKDVTVPYVLLETYPGSMIIHLILQGLDISEGLLLLLFVGALHPVCISPPTFAVMQS